MWLRRSCPASKSARAGALIAAALLLGVVNAFVRPILVILTLPITLLTLGLFLLVINGLMIELVSHFLPASSSTAYGRRSSPPSWSRSPSWLMSSFIGPQGRIEVVTVRHYGRYE